MTRTEEQYMRRALELARRGEGHVEPNPLVGCVIMRNGRVIAEGWHKKFGGPHAEAEALRQAKRRGVSVRGSHVYVTLEPCCHHGKTPPCTDALIAAKVGRVIAAMVDPFSRVSGGGLKALRRAGVKVRSGLCGDEAAEINAPFIRRVTQGLPWVIAKWAQTLDGCLALPANRPGKPAWISGEASRLDAHELRARMDAIIVGVGTVVADDPQLTARGVALRRVARRVVVDPTLRIPLRSRVLNIGDAPTLIAVRQSLLDAPNAKLRRLRRLGIEFVGLPLFPRGKRLDLAVLMRHLVERHQATNVLVEGGAYLLSECFRQSLANEARVYIAPVELGKTAGISRLPRVPDLHGAKLESQCLSRLGPDVCLRAWVR